MGKCGLWECFLQAEGQDRGASCSLLWWGTQEAGIPQPQVQQCARQGRPPDPAPPRPLGCPRFCCLPAGVARFAQKYPALLDALLKSVLELVCKYHKTGGQQQQELGHTGRWQKGSSTSGWRWL